MTKEEKQLLLVDLSARLSYGVKCTTKSSWNGIYTIEGYKDNRFFLDCPVYDEYDDEWMIESVVPYLRPMSSMTEEEKHELLKFGVVNLDKDSNAIDVCCVGFENHAKVQDYLNSIHIDYRGLIKKGLAIEAPINMYKI